ncbi:MAG: hypothetical protein AB4290_03325 [Spirulina sp.]
MTKNTWIVTTGSSDILLKSDADKNHKNKYVRKAKLENNCPRTLKEKEIFFGKNKEKYYSLESRAIARIYGKVEEAVNILVFPLWDSFLARLEKDKIKLDRIIVLLSDQQHIFPPENRKDKPFWKDTIESKELFERYLQNHPWTKEAHIEFLILDPKDEVLNPENKGLDDWDIVLNIMEKTFAEKDDIECGEDDRIYLSHQAGTPAMSSALQFVSLAKFGNAVKFLVANEYDTETANVLSSSRYLRALQLQKAKQLIKKGIPGAALELIKDVEPPIASDLQVKLQEYVDIFNIKVIVLPQGVKLNEFNSKNAGERIRRALDIVEIFFEQENYLAGITLLIAAQETFLKAATIKLLKKISPIDHLKPSELLKWDETGLSFKSQNELKELSVFDSFKNSSQNLSKALHFSIEDKKNDFLRKYLGKKDIDSSDFCLRNICNKSNYRSSSFQIKYNSQLLEWLKELISIQLKKKDWSWLLLDWACQHEKIHDLDRRNQLVHNLRGVEKIDALCYLYSCRTKVDSESLEDYEKEHEKRRKEVEGWNPMPTVKDFYIDEIKKPFVRILYDVELCKNDSTNFLAKDLKDLSDRIK